MHHELIKAHLRMSGWTTKSIAAELGVSPSTVALVIAGNGKSQRIAKRVAQVIGKPVSELWPGRYPHLDKKLRGRVAKTA